MRRNEFLGLNVILKLLSLSSTKGPMCSARCMRPSEDVPRLPFFLHKRHVNKLLPASHNKSLLKAFRLDLRLTKSISSLHCPLPKTGLQQHSDDILSLTSLKVVIPSPERPPSSPVGSAVLRPQIHHQYGLQQIFSSLDLYNVTRTHRSGWYQKPD